MIETATQLSKASVEYGVTVIVMFLLLMACGWGVYKMVTFFATQNAGIQSKLMEIIESQGKIAQRSTDALEMNSKALWEVASALKGCPGKIKSDQ